MVIVLRDGEEVRGIIEWYDRNCIKVNRENGDAESDDLQARDQVHV